MWGVPMNKRNLLKIVNPLLALVFIMTAFPGMIRNFLPDVIPGEMFFMLHPKMGIALFILAICHIALNWGWIKMTFFKAKNVKTK